MPDEEPRRRTQQRRASDQDETYWRKRVDDLYTAVNVVVDTVGQLGTKVGQHHIDIEDKEVRIRKIEQWQARIVGMFAVIVFEIPILVTFVYFVLKR